MFWKKHKWKIIVPVILVVLAAVLFWYGGDAPGLQGWRVESRAGTGKAAMSAEEKMSYAASLAGENTGAQGDAAYSAQQGMVLDPETGLDKYGTSAVPEGKPAPVEPEDAKITNVEHTCTISISCATILDNMEWLAPEKRELVPEDGWVLKPIEVTFYEGESAFDVLRRTCIGQGIHLEFANTPIYNSAYIEGIHNLYEFDCGQTSGWMFCVNGWFPNYGCSRYAMKDGDVLEWMYTCSLGVDIGGYYAVGG